MATSAAARARYERNMRWKEMYEQGLTLQQIADRTGGDYPTTIKNGIESVGGVMRRTGYERGEKNKNKPKKGLIAWLSE